MSAQVGTWQVATGKPKAVACLGDLCESRKGQRATGILIIEADGTYRSPSVGAGCVGGRLVPDEVGLWRLKGRKKLVFQATNLNEIVDAVETCFDGATVNVRRYDNRAKIKRGGQLLKGVTKLRGRVRVQGRNISVKLIMRWKGTPATGAHIALQRSSTLPALIAEVTDQLLEQ